MSRVCAVSGKGPLSGNKRSYTQCVLLAVNGT